MFKVTEEDKTYEDTLKKGCELTSLFMLSLSEYGLKKEDIKTNGFSIREIYVDVESKKDIFSNKTITKKEIDRYQFTQHLQTEMDLDLKKLSELVESTSKMKNPPKINISFGLKDIENAKTEALEKAFWPGRMQLLYDKFGKLRYILDGAHNSHAVKRLVLALQENFPNEKFVTILGVLQDKDHSEMLQMLSNVVSEFYPSGTPYERFTPVETLKMEIENLGLKVKSGNLMSPEFLEDVSKNVSTPILITGSLYLIGASIEILKAEFNELAFFKNLKPFENERH